MMKRMLMLTLVLFGLTQTAQAGEFKPYLGAGLGLGVLKPDAAWTDSGATLDGSATLGVDYGDYLGAELRTGTTGTASITNAGISYDTSVDWFLSYLAKLQAPVSDQLTLYALLGATTSKMTTRITTPGWIFTATGTTKISETTTYATAGVGVDYRLDGQLSLGTELMLYRAGFSALNGTLKYHF